MSLFSRIFGNSHEHKIREMYTNILCTMFGMSPTEARDSVKQAIAGFKEQGKAEGTANLPDNFGDLLIIGAENGEPKSMRIVHKARQEGASDDDICEWWNMPDLGRRMVCWSEDSIRLATFRHAQHEDGLSVQEAATRVHMMFPTYGDPTDESKLSGENRPLPNELRGRVDKFREAVGHKAIAPRVEGFSSYNAFVRDAMRNGEI